MRTTKAIVRGDRRLLWIGTICINRDVGSNKWQFVEAAQGGIQNISGGPCQKNHHYCPADATDPSEHHSPQGYHRIRVIEGILG